MAKQVIGSTSPLHSLLAPLRPRISEHRSTVPPCTHPYGRELLRRWDDQPPVTGLGYERVFEGSARFPLQAQPCPLAEYTFPPSRPRVACTLQNSLTKTKPCVCMDLITPPGVAVAAHQAIRELIGNPSANADTVVASRISNSKVTTRSSMANNCPVKAGFTEARAVTDMV